MYGTIRFIVGIVFLAIPVILHFSKVKCGKLMYIVFTAISLLIVTVGQLFPLENSFVTFDSAKSAYKYYKFGNSNISLVVSGDNCDFVVDGDGSSKTYLIIPKDNAGWKVGIGLDTKKIYQKQQDGIVVNIFRYKNTDNYFITVFDTNGGESAVSDDYDTVFYSLSYYNKALDKTFVTYYGYVRDLPSQYRVIVNGNEFDVMK